MKRKSIFTGLIMGITAFLILAGVACTKEKTNEGEQKVTYKKMTIDELKTGLENKDFLLVNVHIPYAGEIPQTDLFIPYDQIEQNLDKLPEDKNAKIVLYCRSGHMSAIVAKKLAELGYTNIYDVPGGMNAWAASGNELLNKNRN